MADKNKAPNFAIGVAGKREVKRILLKSTNPAATITKFQQTRSLHSMFARAFGTTPHYAVPASNDTSTTTAATAVEEESLDTDSVLTFLAHLGVSHYEVHKRIADSLQKQLEAEIRKLGPNNQQPLLNLLKNCWHHATTVPEFRPILWAVLKQLGEETPLAVLKALGEREGPDSKQMKYAEIFRPLPNFLKRLVWEADWEDKVPLSKELSVTNPKEYHKLVQAPLLYDTVNPIIEQYCATEALVEAAGNFFVASTLERRVLTTQRRALAHTANTTSAPTSTTNSLLGKASNTAAKDSSASALESLQTSGKAISQLRQLLGDTAGGTASYRPKLLHALLSILMTRHGAQAAPRLLSASNLHCTLVADILLSAGGPLPKIYSDVHTLARTLDDAVKNGVLSDKDLITVQQTLKKIYDAEQAETDDKEPASASDKTSLQQNEVENGTTAGEMAKSKTARPSTFLQRQLNRIITAGLQAMKESDPQNLFLNPVTDEIAPGYSKVIKKPMSISSMENKVEHNAYNSIDEWNADVKLMFKNCVDYNRGKAGQWFRVEAGRQLKVFKDEILPEAKRLYQVEQKKRNPEEELKRKREEPPKEPEILPLPPASKKRKLSETSDYTLSMPALASMLLSDPFVVRLLLDRVLRSLRIDVLRGTSIPAANAMIPSFLQLLHMARWSSHLCAIRGMVYLVPDTGMVAPQNVEVTEAMIPFNSLRRFLPIVANLILEADLDKRVAVGGDLNDVADSLPRPPPLGINLEKDSPPYQVIVALLEGAFVHVCLPGNSLETSLAVTFGKFSKVLQDIAGYVWEERGLFTCLVPAILRHKARLNRTVRDTIIATWTSWLSGPEGGSEGPKKKKKKGAMTSACHEYFIHLLNEWASFGNMLLPRDLLLKVVTELVEIVDKTEITPERKFAALWKEGKVTEFETIKKHYERMLSLLPETHSEKWKAAVGINEVADAVEGTENGGSAMEPVMEVDNPSDGNKMDAMEED